MWATPDPTKQTASSKAITPLYHLYWFRDSLRSPPYTHQRRTHQYHSHPMIILSTIMFAVSLDPSRAFLWGSSTGFDAIRSACSRGGILCSRGGRILWLCCGRFGGLARDKGIHVSMNESTYFSTRWDWSESSWFTRWFLRPSLGLIHAVKCSTAERLSTLNIGVIMTHVIFIVSLRLSWPCRTLSSVLGRVSLLSRFGDWREAGDLFAHQDFIGKKWLLGYDIIYCRLSTIFHSSLL